MFPQFVYPLPRGDGLEMMLAQFSGQSCYFTSLLSYQVVVCVCVHVCYTVSQVHGENAPVSLTLTHYTELQDSKGIAIFSASLTSYILAWSLGIVLMLGEFDIDCLVRHTIYNILIVASLYRVL